MSHVKALKAKAAAPLVASFLVTPSGQVMAQTPDPLTILKLQQELAQVPEPDCRIHVPAGKPDTISVFCSNGALPKLSLIKKEYENINSKNPGQLKKIDLWLETEEKQWMRDAVPAAKLAAISGALEQELGIPAERTYLFMHEKNIYSIGEGGSPAIGLSTSLVRNASPEGIVDALQRGLQSLKIKGVPFTASPRTI